MRFIKKILKKLLPESWYIPLSIYKRIFFIRTFSPDKKILNYLASTQGRKKFLIIGVPEHSNIGDHAIAVAEKKFLMDHFPEIDIVEIPMFLFFSSLGKLVRFKDDCVVCCHGGGNLGTLYWECEYMVHVILKYFCRQQVVIFPQTVYWEVESAHTQKIQNYISLYEKHPDLNIFIRDKSIDFMENAMNRNKKFNVFSTPDIVLYLNKSEKKLKRSKVLFCFRSDKEKILDEGSVTSLVSYIQSKGNKIAFTDTQYTAQIPMQCRDFVLERKFNEFRSAKLVITDRLHGMILAAITGTPCIALNNSSAKVEGVYDLWLKQLPYVNFVDTPAEAAEKYDSMDLNIVYNYDPSIFADRWSLISKIIARGIK